MSCFYDPVELIELDENTRLAVYVDDSPESPRDDWQEGVSVHPLHINRSYIPPSPGDNSREHELDAIIEHADDVWEALGKHFQRAGIPFEVTDTEAGQFIWYVEPKTIAENRALAPDWNPAGLLTACIQEYEQWADGEVYGVVLEKRTTWQRIGSDGEPTFTAEPSTRETWEQEDSIWGNYLTDTYTARQVAREHFDIDIPEEE